MDAPEKDTLLVEDVEAASLVKIQIPIIGHLSDPTLEVNHFIIDRKIQN